MNKLVYCNMKLVGHNIFLSCVYMDELWPTDVKQAISLKSESKWLLSHSSVIMASYLLYSALC